MFFISEHLKYLPLRTYFVKKKPAPNFFETGLADLPLDRRMSEYARGHGKFSVFVGGECRRGSCRDASGCQELGKVVVADRPFITTRVSGSECIGCEAFELLVLLETGPGGSDVIVAVPANQSINQLVLGSNPSRGTNRLLWRQ
jgi:hypothetical protein